MSRKKPTKPLDNTKIEKAELKVLTDTLKSVFDKLEPVKRFPNDKLGFMLKNGLATLLRRTKIIDPSNRFEIIKAEARREPDQNKSEPPRLEDEPKNISVASVAGTENETQSTTKKRRGRPKKVSREC